MNAQRIHLTQGQVPLLGSMSSLRLFSNQVEKQEDAGQDDVQQQENDEVSAADEAEVANEPPLDSVAHQIHEMYLNRYGKIKFKNMPQRMLNMDVTTFEYDIAKLEEAFVVACGGRLNKQ